MTINTADPTIEVPLDVLSSPALLFLYYRIEQILGIKAGSEALKNLNQYIEQSCGASFIENPSAYEYLLTSREHIFNISKFLTVNETYFFREGVHFDILSENLARLSKLNRPIQICSAATSIGCEAYSIAMFLDYHAKRGLDFDYNIDAFDVSNEAIAIAKNARYTANTFRTDGNSFKHILDTYLTYENNEYAVSQPLLRKIRFFPHNIMRGFEKHYDIIFFRNALIYFSSKNRLTVINYIAESLFDNGLLFLGISETSAVKHPLLINKYSCDAFYYQKISEAGTIAGAISNNNYKPLQTSIPHKTSSPAVKYTELSVYCPEIAEIIKNDEGRQNAVYVLDMFNNKSADTLSGSQLAATVVFYLHTQDLDYADRILSFLETKNSGAYVKFLRGEYYFLLDIYEEAEKYYLEATAKDKYFWPAFYRITLLSADGNKTRYEYKIKKAIESIELSQNPDIGAEKHYECFMGGFSSDYFLRILEKKLL